MWGIDNSDDSPKDNPDDNLRWLPSGQRTVGDIQDDLSDGNTRWHLVLPSRFSQDVI
jgi:hypothetical protein